MLGLLRRVWNVSRGLLQTKAPNDIKRWLWNREFAGGRWDCLKSTPGDPIYAYLQRYARRRDILDLGCGSGSTGNELAGSAYARYVGVDISDVAIEQAISRSVETGRSEVDPEIRTAC